MNLSVKEDFLKTLDDALEKYHLGPRSQFLRDAVRDKVNRELEEEIITKEMTLPPGRPGKGGRRVLSTPIPSSVAADEPSSKSKVAVAAVKISQALKRSQPTKNKG